jgi:putative spermidine/putrescine transport system permease protein
VAPVVTDGPAFGARAPGALDSIEQSARPRPRVRVSGSRIVSWVVFVLGILYFFVPLYATLAFSLRPKVAFQAYTNVLVHDPGFGKSLLYSAGVGVITIIVSMLIIVPTAYWVRLRLPRLRPVVEFVTLLPFVIPPVILVFGLLRFYGGPPLPLTSTNTGLDILVVAGYVVLSFPYMYRSVDAGLQAIDIRSLTEAGQSMGAGWGRILVQVIFPNLRVALLSGAFLTFSIVIGEYTIASFLVRPAFGPYLSVLGRDKAFEPAAVSIISFGLTWMAMGMIAVLGRGSRTRVQVAGAR